MEMNVVLIKGQNCTRNAGKQYGTRNEKGRDTGERKTCESRKLTLKSWHLQPYDSFLHPTQFRTEGW